MYKTHINSAGYKMAMGDLETRVVKNFPLITRLGFGDTSVAGQINGNTEYFDTLTHYGIRRESFGKEWDFSFPTEEAAWNHYEKILTEYLRTRANEECELVWRKLPEIIYFSSEQYSEPEEGRIKLIKKRNHFGVYSRLKILPLCVESIGYAPIGYRLSIPVETKAKWFYLPEEEQNDNK